MTKNNEFEQLGRWLMDGLNHERVAVKAIEEDDDEFLFISDVTIGELRNVIVPSLAAQLKEALPAAMAKAQNDAQRAAKGKTAKPTAKPLASTSAGIATKATAKSTANLPADKLIFNPDVSRDRLSLPSGEVFGIGDDEHEYFVDGQWWRGRVESYSLDARNVPVAHVTLYQGSRYAGQYIQVQVGMRARPASTTPKIVTKEAEDTRKFSTRINNAAGGIVFKASS